MAHALVIKFSEIRIVLSQRTHRYGPNKKEIQFFLYLGLVILSNEFFSYLILKGFIYRALAVQRKGERCFWLDGPGTLHHVMGQGIKGTPEPKLKDHLFLAMISERRTTPRVRFFCIQLTMFARNRCVASLRGVGSCLYDKMRKKVSYEVIPHLCYSFSK